MTLEEANELVKKAKDHLGKTYPLKINDTETLPLFFITTRIVSDNVEKEKNGSVPMAILESEDKSIRKAIHLQVMLDYFEQALG
jgi:hypothetical protein